MAKKKNIKVIVKPRQKRKDRIKKRKDRTRFHKQFLKVSQDGALLMKHESMDAVPTWKRLKFDEMINLREILRDVLERVGPARPLNHKETNDWQSQNGVNATRFGVEDQYTIPPPITKFEDLQPIPAVTNFLETNHFVSPTPIQCQAIPILLKGLNCIGVAQTGSGKTLAYVIPLLMHVLFQNLPLSRAPIGVVIAPTRELTRQIHGICRQLGSKLGVRCVVCVGGEMQHRDVQEDGFFVGADVVVATPARWLDFLLTGISSTERISFVVLDEVDQLLKFKFEPQIRGFMRQVRPDCVVAMFSASFAPQCQKLAEDLCSKHPTVKVCIGNKEEAGMSINPNITQQWVAVASHQDKKDALWKILDPYFVPDAKPAKFLIFLNTRKRVDVVGKQVNNRYKECTNLTHAAMNLHAGMTISERRASQDSFHAELPILVTTDLGARGLDVQDITCVINFDVPKKPVDYLHRIGRTGRNGKHGDAVTLWSKEDEQVVLKLQKTCGCEAQ
eukprot:TRINITY_DN82504_c0_g1_i1.p1 TRINITY_DN82504_c0_g1~~TRINITY_DN82504_c0_g1_i1.p1  ORF type:complete len:503 (-),score=65.67 TRINITY_DN82504_c0_g1_i1:8-1516(-)